MATVRKFKIPITILAILMLILYVSISNAIFIIFLTASENVVIVTMHLMELFDYIGFSFNTTIAFLIIPASILLIINIKKIEIDKGYIICQILSFISLLLILLSLFIPFLLYLTWLEDQPGVNTEIWGTMVPIFTIYVLELIFNLIMFILLTVKHD
ncbi:MAG: hypothetical protein ACFFHD_15420 [Promethearchaeota archaeon]